MRPALVRTLFWLPLLLAVAGALVWLLRPEPVAVETAIVDRGSVPVRVEDEGRTRVREVFRVLAPVSGSLVRIALDPGDAVDRGSVLARIQPTDPALLDLRTRLERLAELGAAEAAVAEAEAALEHARAALDYAVRELERARTLAERNALAAAALDRAEMEQRARMAEVEAASARLRRARHERDRVRAALLDAATLPPEARATSACCVPVVSPVSGRVLRVLRRDAGPVEAGEPLLEVGDPRDLEIVVELLTRDAARVRPGAAAEIVEWGGDEILAGRVRRVEPSAFTDISALGVEEQRVETIVDFVDRDRIPDTLADGWRVLVRILVEQRDDVLRLPTGALFRDAGSWATFVVGAGRARLRHVEIGARNDEHAEIVSGLEAGEEVVLFPSDRVADGVAVVRRPAG